MFLCNPIIGQTLTFKKMPFLMWEPLETYIFDKSLPHKFVLNMEHGCKEMIHHSHDNLINYCKDNIVFFVSLNVYFIEECSAFCS